MGGRAKPHECPKGAPAYMLTWGDMCTLLLCFFVLLLAMSSTDPGKFDVAASSLMNALGGVLESYPSVVITQDVLVPRLGGNQQNKHMAVDAAMKIKKVIKEENLDEAIKVKVTESGIAIKVADPIGFDLGAADVKPELIATLYGISKIINRTPGTKIRVEGHTDDTPIHTSKYPSNWDLSADRALNVVKFFAENGGIDPSSLSAVGYGEFRPLLPNTTMENKKINRRIEIFVDYMQIPSSE
jgi:chemotaxis protein MotB